MLNSLCVCVPGVRKIQVLDNLMYVLDEEVSFALALQSQLWWLLPALRIILHVIFCWRNNKQIHLLQGWATLIFCHFSGIFSSALVLTFLPLSFQDLLVTGLSYVQVFTSACFYFVHLLIIHLIPVHSDRARKK